MRCARSALAFGLLAAAACSAVDDDAVAPESAPITASTTTILVDAPTTPTTSLNSSLDTPNEFSDLARVMISTPSVGGGAQPMLEWAPVDGADSYVLVVFDTAGGPYWAWEGAAASVRLGGTAEPVEDGPRLVGQQTWQVVALDHSGVVATSPITPIAP